MQFRVVIRFNRSCRAEGGFLTWIPGAGVASWEAHSDGVPFGAVGYA